jgi:hypothetical protein
MAFTSPWDGEKPNVKQQKFLDLLLRSPLDEDDKIVVHYVGGRGSAKTASLLMGLVESAHNINSGLLHLWTSPTVKDVYDTFIPMWTENVPARRWKLNKSKNILFYNNGRDITQINLRGRDVFNSQKDAFSRGPNYAAAFFDEPCIDKTNAAWLTMYPSVRHPEARRLMIGTGSTPKLGWYHELVVNGVEDGRSYAVYGESFDNPHVKRKVVERFLAELDPKRAEQEVYARWVALGNQIWDNANLLEDWPNGNLHEHEWNRGIPFTLSLDLGARSGWIIIQTIEAFYGGPNIDVAVAQYTPNHGDTESVARDILANYGQPMRVIMGADANTGAYMTDGRTATQLMRNLGIMCPIRPVSPGSVYYGKDIQYWSAKRTIGNHYGNRIFCISKKIRTHMNESNVPNRGIREVLSQDTWPEKSNRSGSYLPKGSDDPIGLEHIRDAFLYFSVDVHPVRGFGGELERRVA